MTAVVSNAVFFQAMINMAAVHPVAEPYLKILGYSPLTVSFFSVSNVRTVMSMILERVHALVGHLLPAQDERELVLSMRYVYMSSCGPDSVDKLNKYVVDVCSRVIVQNLREYVANSASIRQGRPRMDPRPVTENRASVTNSGMELTRF